MLDFLVVWSSRGVDRWTSRSDDLARLGRRLIVSAGPVSVFRAWYPEGSGNVGVFTWSRDLYPFAAADRVAENAGDLRFYSGWVVPERGAPWKSIAQVQVDDLALDSPLEGEYVLGVARRSGDIHVRRSLMGSVQLYWARDRDHFVLATRAALCRLGHEFNTAPNVPAAFARSVLSSSVCMNDLSLFEGVRCLEQGTSVVIPAIGRPVLYRPTHEPLFDDGMRDLYRQDRCAYWDLAYERTLRLFEILDLVDVPIEFPLSGGKDSRLLLGLMAAAGQLDKVGTIYTAGQDESPEVRSAAEVVGLLRRRHEIRRPGGSAPVGRDIRRKLLRHAFMTECEVSPMDLFWQTTAGPAVQLHGQEGGLRNIAGTRVFESKEALLHWFRVHLGRFDFCGVLRDDAREANEIEFLDYFTQSVVALDDFEQLPSKHRVEFRFKRWVARTWSAYNSTSFAPYFFASDAVMKATYNAGARSRSAEEFHFEMLRRCSPELVRIPFANQRWPGELTGVIGETVPQPEPYTWPDTLATSFAQRPTHAALRGRFDDLKSLLQAEQPDWFQAVVDPEKLVGFDAADMQPGHVQPLWQLVNLYVASTASSFDELDTLEVDEVVAALPDFDSDS